MVPAALRRVVGRPTARWTEATRDATQSRVWRVDGGGPTLYVKQHTTPAKYRRERDALPVLAAHDLGPPLIGHDDGLRLLLIAPCPGAPVAADPAAVELAAVDPGHWEMAGATLRAIHRLPCPADPLPLADAIGRRLAGWRARAAGVIAPATLDALTALVGDGAAFADATRVFCHRDYAPRNWRVADRCRAFDPEHAGPDAPEADLVRLYDAPAFADPAVEAAFYAGYGARPDRERLRVMLALHALATATWGRLHGDPSFAARGDRLATRLLSADRGKRPAAG